MARTKLDFQWDEDDVHILLDQHTLLDVLTHRNNSPLVDMSLHWDTLFWFRANNSLLVFLNGACLAEKQICRILGKHANHYTTDAVFLA